MVSWTGAVQKETLNTREENGTHNLKLLSWQQTFYLYTTGPVYGAKKEKSL